MEIDMSSTNKTAIIKPLSADDLEAVIAIDKQITGAVRKGFFEKRLKAALEMPGDFIYVGLHAGGVLAGYGMAKLVAGEFGSPGASASLDAMGVDPSFQGKGGGHKILKAIEDILTRKGVDFLTSQVPWSERAMLGFFSEAGFDLAPNLVLNRDTTPMQMNEEFDEADLEEIDFSAPEGDDPGALSNDKVPVRSMSQEDLSAMISIDKKSSGTDRSAYFRRKQDEVLHQSGVRVSLVAELDEHPVGFIMARVDYGEFGRASSAAIMDTIGVDPGYGGQGVGQALMQKLIANLAILQVETIRTEVGWNETDMIAYLDHTGFSPAQTVVVSKKL
jgi:GNAT superfamily N-acetyltransferase